MLTHASAMGAQKEMKYGNAIDIWALETLT